MEKTLLEVHVAGVCFWQGKCVVVKRSLKKKLYPGLWETGGGKVEWGENFEEAVRRELREELGVELAEVKVMGTYEILVPEREQQKILGLKFFCRIGRFLNGKGPELSEEHTEHRLVSVEQLDGLEFVEGIEKDIRRGFEMIEED